MTALQETKRKGGNGMAKRNGRKESRHKLLDKLMTAARWDTDGLLGRIIEGVAIGLIVALIQKALNL